MSLKTSKGTFIKQEDVEECQKRYRDFIEKSKVVTEEILQKLHERARLERRSGKSFRQRQQTLYAIEYGEKYLQKLNNPPQFNFDWVIDEMYQQDSFLFFSTIAIHE
jgi:hypothetical protein